MISCNIRIWQRVSEFNLDLQILGETFRRSRFFTYQLSTVSLFDRTNDTVYTTTFPQ